jgi:hypothetical protein
MTIQLTRAALDGLRDALSDDAIDLFFARANDMIVPSASQQILFSQGG